MPRISWSPDGDRLLVVQDGEVRIFDLVTAQDRRLAGSDYFDARWMNNGGVTAGLGRGGLVRFTIHGERYDETELGTFLRVAGRLSHEARVMIFGGSSLGFEIGNDRLYRALYLDRTSPVHVELCDDADRVAMTYRVEAFRSLGWPAARGWLVAATDFFAEQPHGRVILDVRAEGEGEPPAMRFAFDSHARRLAIAGGESRGVVRLGADGPVHAPGDPADALALDPRGMLAAYANGRTLRIDYLDPVTAGPRVVTVVDTLAIETGLDDITALAFDPTSRSIACVSAANAVEIVPVL